MKISDIIRSINETASAGATSAGAIAGSGFAIGIGSTERATNPTKKKKSKLIKR